MTPYSLAGITQVGSDAAVMHSVASGTAGAAPGVGPLGPFLGEHAPLASALQPGLVAVGGSAVSAGIGRATLVGSLSVPQSWATAAPATTPAAATAFPAAGWTAAPAVGEMAGAPGMPGMPMMGTGARGIGFAAPRYGFRPTVMAHPPAAG